MWAIWQWILQPNPPSPARCGRLSLLPAAADTVENGPLRAARRERTPASCGIRYYDTVLVVAARKCAKSPAGGNDFVATMTHPEAEYLYGITLPAWPVCSPGCIWKNTA